MENKYRQTIIPSVETEKHTNLAKYIKDYYKEHFQGNSVVNAHIGIKITFTSLGKSELAHGRALHSKKAAIIKCLPTLLKYAEYNNFGIRKQTDQPSILGYLNFKAKVKINGKTENTRLTVLLKKDGQAFYHPFYHYEVNTKKHKTPLVRQGL